MQHQRYLGSVAAVLILAAAALPALCQETAIAVPDSLIALGIPPIPQSIVDGVGRYTEFRAAGFQSWDPAGKGMLILTRFADTAQVHSVAMPGGDRHQLTFYPDGISSAFYGPSSPDWFVFQKDVGGNEQFQYYRYDLSTGNATLLTDGKSRNTDGIIEHDGRTLVYMSTRRTGNDTDLYAVNVEDPKSDHMIAQLQGGGWTPADVADDGKTGILQNYVSVNESHLYLVDMKTGQMREITPASGPAVAYGGAVFSRDGKSVLLTSDEGTEFLELRRMDLGTGRTVSLTHSIPWDVESFAISDDRKRMAFIANENGSSVLYTMDPANGRYKKAPGLPACVISGLKWRKNGPDLGLSLDTAQATNDAYSYDTKAGKLTRWTLSESGGLNPSEFQPQRLVTWKSFDGRDISGWLTMPPAAKFPGPRPVLLDIHGGPEGESRPGFMGRYNYYINELGIAVLEPNVRGSTGFGKTFSKLDNGVLRADSYKDIGALLDWIKTQPDLNASKVMVTGGSYGGHMTYAISYMYADRIACSLPVVGMTNLVTFLENTSGYRRDLRRVEYGDERDPATRKILEDIAPMNHASEITKPIFVVAGQNDPRVPISEATQFETKIKSTNPNVWFLVGKNEGHGFTKKKNRDFQMYATVLFMEKFLLG